MVSKPQKHPRVSLKVSGKRAVPQTQMRAEQESFGQVRKSVVFLAAVALLYFLYLVFTGQISSFIEALAGVDTNWVLAGLLCYVAYYFFGVLAYVVAAVTDPKSPVGILDLMSVEAAGIFFSNLTPNGAGGAPAQIVRLTRSGLSVGAAGALQYTRFIVYEAGEGIFAALMLIFRLDYFIATYGDIYVIGLLLFGFKILEVAGLLLICLMPHYAIKLGNGAVRFGARFGWVKRPEHWHKVINTQVNEFSRGFRLAAKNLKEMGITLIVTLVQLGCMYALPWFVLKAFHLPADLLTCLAAGSMLELLTSAIPLPGGTGGAEGGFAFLFRPMFGDVTSAAFVVWRMIEYFLPIMVSALLLGLRSRSGLSIYDRWSHMRRSRAGLSSTYTRKKQKRQIQANLSKVRSKGSQENDGL